jgi:hypothetical protein
MTGGRIQHSRGSTFTRRENLRPGPEAGSATADRLQPRRDYRVSVFGAQTARRLQVVRANPIDGDSIALAWRC